MALLKLEDLSKELKVHNNTIYKWLKQGLPHFKKGQVIRFNLEKVLVWLEKNEDKEVE
jgi:excisionase family DNA binding protein